MRSGFAGTPRDGDSIFVGVRFRGSLSIVGKKAPGSLMYHTREIATGMCPAVKRKPSYMYSFVPYVCTPIQTSYLKEHRPFKQRKMVRSNN